MTKIRSLEELKKLGDELASRTALKSDKDHPSAVIQIKVAMATCGIASGAKAVMEYMREELEKRSIPAEVTQTGCMCYCYAEPTVEVTIPGREPVIFGYVSTKKADEIIERYIRKGELVDGVIAMDYETIDSK
jgi:NADP-reducing hydrogenase subunit HndB